MTEQPANPRWVTALNRSRPMTWIALAINAAFAVAMFYAIRAGSAQGWCTGPNCGDRNIGAMVGPWWLLFVWAVADIVVGVIWWFGRPRST